MKAKKGIQFNLVQQSAPSKNNFDLSHDLKGSGNFGKLMPVCCIPTLPGDRFTIGNEILVRFQPMTFPIMHNCYVTVHYFHVPNRLLWDNWTKFISNNDGGMVPEMPFLNITPTTAPLSSLADYLGIPPPPTGKLRNVSAFPFAAFQMIYNEYYRDENLVTPINFKLIDGNNSGNTALYQMRKSAWEHDYFTSCLPFQQKGDPVNLPIANFNDVPVYINQLDNVTVEVESPGVNFGIMGQQSPDPLPLPNELYADTSELIAAAATVNDLRTAMRVQEWLEKLARSGSRYTEILRGFWNVISSDRSLQRPEYITGVKESIRISEVLNTAGSGDLPQGNMAGHGVTYVDNRNYGYFNCEEHGYIIGIMRILPKTAYMQGIARDWLKFDPLEFGWPQFAQLGEQPVYNGELYAYGNDPDFLETFGFLPRFQEYKYESNRVAGQFRTSLDAWHIAREFGSQPQLNQEFIEMDSTAADRIFAVTDPEEDKLLFQCMNHIGVYRALPVFGTPTF